MWIAVNLTTEQLTTTHEYLMACMAKSLKEQPVDCSLILKWNLSAGQQDLVEICCKTSRPCAPPGSYNRPHSVKLVQLDGIPVVSVTQQRPHSLQDYVHVIGRAGNCEYRHIYESYDGDLDDMDVWITYPEVLLGPLLGPSANACYIDGLNNNNTLTKLVGDQLDRDQLDNNAGYSNPQHVYVINITGDMISFYDHLKGIGKVTILPDELHAAGQNIAAPEHLGDYCDDSIVIGHLGLVTPKREKPQSPRKCPGAPRRPSNLPFHRKSSRRSSFSSSNSMEVDPLEDEGWQIDVERTLRESFPNND